MNTAGRARVSVIIPTYNRSGMVVEAVTSALTQSYREIEVIVVDDGSSDDTCERLNQFNDRIVLVKQKNQGVAAARNSGLARATGEFIAFLDSDDLWHQRKIEAQLAYLQSHPDMGLLACRVGALTDRPQVNGPLPNAKAIPCTQISCTSSALRARFATSSVLVRRNCLDAVGHFDTKLAVAEDRDLWIRVASRFEVWMQDIDLAYHRPNHPDHLSAKPGNEGNTRQMIEKVFREIPELRKRPALKRQALSVAAYEASIIRTQWGEHSAAIGMMMRSLVLWPIPNDSIRNPRLKSLVVMALRLARLRRN